MTKEEDTDAAATRDQEARELIIRGHLEGADDQELAPEVHLTESYFRRITTYDLERLLSNFERELFEETRQVSGQLLAAYFDWCFRKGRKVVPRSQKQLGIWAFSMFRVPTRGDDEFVYIDAYLARFAQIAVTRMVGAYDGIVYQRTYNRLPTWVRPDVVFGWARTRGRPPGSDNTRDMATYAYAQLLRCKGTGATIANQRAAQKYGCSVSKVEKTLKKMDNERLVVVRSGERKFPYELTKDELQDLLKDLSKLM